MFRFPWQKPKRRQRKYAAPYGQTRPQEPNRSPVTKRIEHTIGYLEQCLGQSDDFVIRTFHVMGDTPAVICYFTHLTDGAHKEILKSLMTIGNRQETAKLRGDKLTRQLMNDFLFASDGFTVKDREAVSEELLGGSTIVHVEGSDEICVFGTRNIEKRAIDQPETEQVIRGPREGFIEPISTNLSLIRYRLQSPDLRIKTLKLGKRTRSAVAVCYMDGITNRKLLDEVMHRLSLIDIDGILDSGYLEQLIEDNHYSPFPQVQLTERPDKAVANLLEGRVILIVDGSPMALIVPTVFTQFYQTSEDYAERFLLVSFIRLARLLALLFSLVFPSLYVAIISFNPELIPTEFAVAVAGGRAGVPFPAVVEVLIMEISMEVLREATIRLPQQVGGALSIVGVLVVGQAAVAAGFVSPITVVVIALTTIGSFATPAYNAALALRLLRFPIIIASGMFGLYGVMVGLIFIANHMLSLKSFGVPYLSPIVPGDYEGMKDSLFRAPLWWMKRRPAMLQPGDDTRLSEKRMHELEHSKHNVLDPLPVRNESGEGHEGQSASNHGNPSGDHRY
ncbi:spore germination protein [Paenibacillus oceani]|uniref:Spore germination protein n=1 Tax=Paenibacillus oceani TaxID=2772510 RepID=A0A927CCA6_9BACL|nr:spore germination protein [Paenibacillus oceani]MBD2863947.1 spore germination protein [Paenibacillus oceani]